MTECAIVEAARQWLGTPFHPQGRVRDHGVDCLGLILGVASQLCIFSKSGVPLVQCDVCNYNIAKPNADVLLPQLHTHLIMVKKACLTPGMVICCLYPRGRVHLGFISDDVDYIIHASMTHNKVVEERIDITQNNASLWQFYK